MSRAEPAWVIAITVLLPFAAAALLALAGRAERTRRIVAVAYAAAAAGFDLALLNGYLEHSGRASWGSLKFSYFSFPAFIILNLLAAAVVLYAAFRPASSSSPALLIAVIPAACGLAGLALAVSTLLPFVLLWLGVTALAALGLLAHGSEGIRRRFRAFLPWLGADLLLVLGAVLCGVWLKETSVLIAPPLTHGSEMQTVIICALFLGSALLRLGVFPLTWWIGDLTTHTDPAWSSFFLGSANFVMASTRLVVTMVLIGRLVASDWGPGLTIAALFSIVIGPVLALRARSAPSALAGLYCMQSGFLLFTMAMFSRVALESGLFMSLTAPVFITGLMMALGTTTDARGSACHGGAASRGRVHRQVDGHPGGVRQSFRAEARCPVRGALPGRDGRRPPRRREGPCRQLHQWA
jgi:NADH:ubiquinone oxidoreductase subunit 2 (subunit N)